MNYTDPYFLTLFLFTQFLFWFFPSQRLRMLTLSLASAIFYAWSSYFDALIFLGIICLIWLTVYLGERTGRKHLFIPAGIGILLLHLGFWKYMPWFRKLAGEGAWPFALPLGISFITLQGLAYLIDYRRNECRPLKFSELFLFKAYFAQLIAGPITRVHELVPQLQRLATPSEAQLFSGMTQFTQGLVKKILIADSLAPFVDLVFETPSAHSSMILLWAAVAYAGQIYGDFSGYSDMGIGLSRMLGIELPENFLNPYRAVSPSDFWKRWHITLSRWIRDYLYRPLGGSRGGRYRNAAILMATFAISGLWHGANFTFLLWGLYHGLWVMIERRWPFRSTTLTFLLVTFGWVLFRSPSLQVFGQYVKSFCSLSPGLTSDIAPTILPLVFCVVFHCFSPRSLERLAPQRWVGFGFGVLSALILLSRSPGAARAFIYFQF